MRQSMTEHEAVFKALEAGDGERASAAIRDHVAVQGESPSPHCKPQARSELGC